MRRAAQVLSIASIAVFALPAFAGADEVAATAAPARVWQNEPCEYLQDDFTDAARAMPLVVASDHASPGDPDRHAAAKAQQPAPLAQPAVLN